MNRGCVVLGLALGASCLCASQVQAQGLLGRLENRLLASPTTQATQPTTAPSALQSLSNAVQMGQQQVQQEATDLQDEAVRVKVGLSSTAPSTQPTTAPAQAQPTTGPVARVKIGDLAVRVTGVSIGLVPLQEVAGISSVSQQPLLMVHLEVRNASTTQKHTYQSWQGRAISLGQDHATLSDDKGNSYQRMNFGLAKVVGRTDSQSLAPGKTLSDVLVFQAPAATASVLTLQLPAANIGGQGTVNITIPVAAIRK